MGRSKGRMGSVCDEFDLSYFPEPTSEEALLALALMREGRGLNHPAYAFLSFFRVLDVSFPDPQTRMNWINENIGSVQAHRVAEAVADLRGKGITDIGLHLYASGRCAVAHANRTPIVDPDDPSDMRRLYSELPIIRALAAKAIEEKLVVESRITVYRKHLYELDGFKKILGPDLVNCLARGEQVTDQRIISIPDISVEIRGRAPYAPLSNLSIQALAQDGTVLHVLFGSSTGVVRIRFHLDFAEERLSFSIFDDIGMQDLGSADSAAEIAELQRFHKEYVGNGALRILNAETGEPISRKDAYIPVNMFLDVDAADAAIAQWKHLEAERRNCEEQYDHEMWGHLRWYDIRLNAKT
jgi:hypothetical protein